MVAVVGGTSPHDGDLLRASAHGWLWERCLSVQKLLPSGAELETNGRMPQLLAIRARCSIGDTGLMADL
jgi:hypothetical protein